MRETKHFFRNNKVGSEPKYIQSTYAEWKEKHIELTNKSFEILQFILQIESSVTSVILEHCISSKIIEDTLLIDKINSCNYVKKIPLKKIKFLLKKIDVDEFTVKNFIFHYPHECIHVLSFKELVDLLRFMTIYFPDTAKNIYKAIFEHPEYIKINEMIKVSNNKIYEDSFSGELQTWSSNKNLTFGDIKMTEGLKAFSMSKSEINNFYQRQLNQALINTIRNHKIDSLYLNDNLSKEFKKSIGYTLNMFIEFRNTCNIDELLCELTTTYSREKVRHIKKMPLYKDATNYFNEFFFEKYFANLDNIEHQSLLAQILILPDIELKDCKINNDFKIMKANYNSPNYKFYKFLVVITEFRNSISHGKIFMSPIFDKTDINHKFLIFEIFERYNFISSHDREKIIDTYKYYFCT